MPAGDLVVADWQVELRGTLTGAGTVYENDEPGWGGFGHTAKTNDTDLGHDAGFVHGRDYQAGRIITFPYVMHDDDAATAFTRWQALAVVWAIEESAVLPLHLQMGGVHLSFVGRPRSLVEDFSLLPKGAVRALATFECGDPTMTVVP